MKKRIVILGSTGSVGRNVLDVVDHHTDRFDVVGLAAGRNAELLAAQAAAHAHARVAVGDPAAYELLIAADPALAKRSVGVGDEGLLNLVERCEPDLVVNCLVGFVGLQPTLTALAAGVPVALANKESIVTGGGLIREASDASGAELIPIDSEHVAISQCLRGCPRDEIQSVYITASGGALRDRPLAELDRVTPEEVLAHPTWDMGAKITVDSATLINKGLEVIEAHWLFGLDFDQIRVVVHPQSIVHSLVEFRDNSILAQLGIPDMRLPILYALTYPDKIETPIARSSVSDFPDLSFREVDEARYPCLGLVLGAGRAGGNQPAILNSANEVAVGAFLAHKLSFSNIYNVIDAALNHVPHSRVRSFEDVLDADRRTRAFVKERFGV